MTSLRSFPCISPAAGAFIIYFGRSPSRRPRLVHYLLSFPYEYELICSFNTFCTCRHPYYVQKTYKTTYESIFSLHSPGESGPWVLPPSGVRDVTRSFPASRRSGEHSLYLSGVLRGGDPVLYVIYFHLCTKYELICSFNTFCTCIRPYLRTENVQNYV